MLQLPSGATYSAAAASPTSGVPESSPAGSPAVIVPPPGTGIERFGSAGGVSAEVVAGGAVVVAGVVAVVAVRVDVVFVRLRVVVRSPRSARVEPPSSPPPSASAAIAPSTTTSTARPSPGSR